MSQVPPTVCAFYVIDRQGTQRDTFARAFFEGQYIRRKQSLVLSSTILSCCAASRIFKATAEHVTVSCPSAVQILKATAGQNGCPVEPPSAEEFLGGVPPPEQVSAERGGDAYQPDLTLRLTTVCCFLHMHESRSICKVQHTGGRQCRDKGAILTQSTTICRTVRKNGRAGFQEVNLDVRMLQEGVTH